MKLHFDRMMYNIIPLNISVNIVFCTLVYPNIDSYEYYISIKVV